MSTHEVITRLVEVHDGPPPESGAADQSPTKEPPALNDLLLPFVVGVAFGAFGLVILGLTLADAASRARTLRDEGGEE